jgi:ribosomal protein S18 acetylase RimI-like enzyme
MAVPVVKTIPVRIQMHQVDQARRTLGEAFLNYPLSEHLFPDIEQRKRLVPLWIGYTVNYAFRYGLVYATPRMEGVAVWINPENAHMSYARHIISGMLGMPFQFGFHTFGRMMRVEAFMEERWREMAPKKRWYLWSMGVLPAAQRKGIGADLLNVVLNQIDAGGYPCCLETHSTKTVAFYQKFGFETVFQGMIPGHRIEVTMMMRKPR